MSEKSLTTGGRFTYLLLWLVYVGFAGFGSIIILEVSILLDPALITEQVATVREEMKIAESFQKIGELYVLYYYLISAQVWQVWVIFGLGLITSVFLLDTFSRRGQRSLLSSKNKDLKRLYQQERELRLETEERLAKFDENIIGAYEHSHIGLMLVATDNVIHHVNERAAGMVQEWNDDVKTIVGSPIGDVFPKLTKTDFPSALKNTFNTQTSCENEIHLSDIDVWLEVRIFPAMQGAFVALQDITHRKKNKGLLEVSESLLNQVVTTIPFPMAILNVDWTYQLVSPRWTKQFGLEKRGDIKGQNHIELIPNLPGNMDVTQRQLNNGQTVQEEETKLMIGGQEEYVNWRISPWKNPYGDISGYLSFVEVVTQEVQEKMRMKNQRVQEQKLAYQDALTGLPNRQLFRDRLNMALASAYRELGRVALLFLDLDGFKAVNDTLGHDMGDLLLRQVANRLQGCVRQTDTVARLGGDEFTVILTNIKRMEDVESLSQKIIEVVSKPYDLGGKEGKISTSIGISLYPDDTNSAADMIRFSDEAMYVSKKSGKNQFTYFKSLPDDKKAEIEKAVDSES